MDRKCYWQEMILKNLGTLWIYWVFQRFLCNYLKLDCVLNSCNLWALHVLPLCCYVWLPSDHLARYYSLCDIGILAPVFVTAYEFCLCDGRLVPTVCRQWVLVVCWWWVSSLWWQISSDCVLAISYVFVTANEFCLCDDAVTWPWVGFSGFKRMFS